MHYKETSSLIQMKPKDKCGFYAETNLNAFPVEPLAAFTNLIFPAVIIYWTVKTKFRIRLYPLIVIIMPLMTAAFFFGTMFHILRNDVIWHHLNMLSILYAVIAGNIYLWRRVVKSWWKTFLLTLLTPVLFQIFILLIQPVDKISVSTVFTVMFLSILIPSALHCIKNRYHNFHLLVVSSIFFGSGIILRTADKYFLDTSLPGTHFLWHIAGGISIFFFLKYIYESDKEYTVKKFAEKASSFGK
jgi:hemolysin III